MNPSDVSAIPGTSDVAGAYGVSDIHRTSGGSAVSDTSVIVHADKTVLKITGLKIRGLNTASIEDMMRERFHSAARVIGVTGTSLEMDVYGVDPADIYREEGSLIEALSLCEGILSSEVAQVAAAERIVELDWDSIPEIPPSACLMERIMLMKSSM